jgi:hypothetical protein
VVRHQTAHTWFTETKMTTENCHASFYQNINVTAWSLFIMHDKQVCLSLTSLTRSVNHPVHISASVDSACVSL